MANLKLERWYKQSLKGMYDHIAEATAQVAQKENLDLVIADQSPDIGPDLDKPNADAQLEAGVCTSTCRSFLPTKERISRRKFLPWLRRISSPSKIQPQVPRRYRAWDRSAEKITEAVSFVILMPTLADIAQLLSTSAAESGAENQCIRGAATLEDAASSIN